MEHYVIRTVFNPTITNLSSSFPFVRGEVLPATFSPPHLLASLFHPPLSPVLFFQFTSSLAFFTSLLTQSSHISFGLPRLRLPCSRNYAALFGRGHPQSFLRIQPTVICSSPVSMSSSSALPSLPITPPFFAYVETIS